jgi:RHS repeat-associated protein
LRDDTHKYLETIEYNYLNLPSRILFTNDRSIAFLYDATGKKLRKTVTGNGQTEQRDYLDGIEYKDGKPDQFLHSEGTVRADKDGQYHYYFVLRDHLGNTRVTFSDLNNDDKVSEKEELIQINNYYAFGLNMEGNWNGANGANKNQYNGKEWNDDFGLGWNDYGARFYDPAMARWQAVDPMADSRLSLSPYQYVQNNPMGRVDPTGMLDESGKGKSPIEEHQDRFWEEPGKEKPEKGFMPPNQLPMRQQGTLWGRGNIWQRAWTWLKSGGKETMDSHGNRYGAVKKAIQTTTSVPAYGISDNKFPEIVQGDGYVAEQFIANTLLKVDEQFSKLLTNAATSINYDGSLASVDQLIKYMQKYGGSELYSFKDGMLEGVFSGIEGYVVPNGSTGGPRDPDNPNLMKGYYKLVQDPKGAIGTYIPLPLPINSMFAPPPIRVNQSHLGWISGQGFTINFYLQIDISGNL